MDKNTVLVFDTVAVGFAWMGIFDGINFDGADIEGATNLDGDEGHVGLHVGEGDGEVAVLLLVLEGILDIMNAIEVEFVAGDEGGDEEGEALEVVPVGVGEEEVKFAFALAAGAAHEFVAEGAEAGASIDDEGVIIGLDLDTGSIAASGAFIQNVHVLEVGVNGRFI